MSQKQYWSGLEDLNNIATNKAVVENEFKEKNASPGRMKRRRYSKKLTNP